MPATAATPTARIARELRAERAELVATLLERRVENPFFAGFRGPHLAGLETDAGRLIDALCTALEQDRPVAPDDVMFLCDATASWTARGGRLEDIGHGLLVLQRTLFGHVTALAAAQDDPRAAVAVGARLLELVDVATAVLAESWVDGREGDAAARRRALLDELLAGRTPADRALAAQLGLDGADVLVVAARIATGEGSANAALGALSRAGGPAVLPLAADIDGELVVLRTVPDGDVEPLVAALEKAWRRLADTGARLAVGVSAPQRVPEGVPAGLGEARLARGRVAAAGGVVALPRLDALDWMTLRADETTWRLVDPRIRAFLEEDAAGGGQLRHTLEGYVASDLNLRETARRLHLHVNTVRYRLGRIAERTGVDLRHLDDLVALVVATHVHDARRPL